MFVVKISTFQSGHASPKNTEKKRNTERKVRKANVLKQVDWKVLVADSVVRKY